MKTTVREMFYAVILLILIYCFFNRYEIIAVGSRAYKINKITGQTYSSGSTQWKKIENE